VVEDSPVENRRANPATVATIAFHTSPMNLLPVATPRSPASGRCAERRSQHQRATPAPTSFLSGGRGSFVQQRRHHHSDPGLLTRLKLYCARASLFVLTILQLCAAVGDKEFIAFS